MKILVIGNGLIGKSITQKLFREGHELINFSRTTKIGIPCQQILGDIFEPDGLKQILGWKPEVVIHTAWITTPRIYKDDLSNYKYAKSTIDLVKSVLVSSVEHLVVLGTCAEYGFQNMPSTAGITELSPKTLYAEQKVVTLNSIKELLVSSEIRFTWARVFHPYGPTQDPKRLIPYLIEALRSGRPIKLVDTTSLYDWVSVRDIASAISWVITNRLSTEIDIGTTFGYSNLELLNTLIELFPNISQDGNFGPHEIGLGEVFIVGKDSPLIKSGWLPNDSLKSGLEWVLST